VEFYLHLAGMGWQATRQPCYISLETFSSFNLHAISRSLDATSDSSKRFPVLAAAMADKDEGVNYGYGFSNFDRGIPEDTASAYEGGADHNGERIRRNLHRADHGDHA
jgi:hypothetical protein